MTEESMTEAGALIDRLGAAARAAQRRLAATATETRDGALKAMAEALRGGEAALLAANARDVEAAGANGISGALLDRLTLTPARIAAMAAGLDGIAALPDPLEAVLADWTRPNGLRIERVSVPLGVIGIIYESRPNVTADAAGLCLKAGNACILRGGSEAAHSNRAIAALLSAALADSGLPTQAVQLVPTQDRDAVGALLACHRHLDVIIPRGGPSLVERVSRESRVPVFAHLSGLCHTYLHAAAEPEMALSVVVNAKMRRTGVCGATETLLVDRAVHAALLPPILDALIERGCEIRGDAAVQALDARVRPAAPEDWDTEYLDAVLSVKTVADANEAIDHINRHGSHHTDAIVTADALAAADFLRRVDSGIVLHNASTQFADGGEFGFGAEIGIATGRLHARGPVGAAQLTSFQYRVHGSGQTRPA